MLKGGGRGPVLGVPTGVVPVFALVRTVAVGLGVGLDEGAGVGDGETLGLGFGVGVGVLKFELKFVLIL